MKMHNPAHPGEIIKSSYIDHLGLTHRKLAELLNVSPSAIGRLIAGKSSVSTDMAMRLSKSFGRSPELWLRLQIQYDLWHAQQNNEIFVNVQRYQE